MMLLAIQRRTIMLLVGSVVQRLLVASLVTVAVTVAVSSSSAILPLVVQNHVPFFVSSFSINNNNGHEYHKQHGHGQLPQGHFVNTNKAHSTFSTSKFTTSTSLPCLFAHNAKNMQQPKQQRYKVHLQKVIRPPPQLNVKQQPNQLILFLPSLINYLQSSYTLPNNLPMTFDILEPTDSGDDYDNNNNNRDNNDNNENYGNYENNDTYDKYDNYDDNDSNKQVYSILEIKSPLASKNDSQFHLYVEVIGLYIDSSSSTTTTYNNNNKSHNQDSNYQPITNLPSMAMVVIKTKQQHSATSSSSSSNNNGDIIRQRLFQDSIDKIIQSLDSALDSYALGDIPLHASTNASDSASSTGSSRKSHKRHESNRDNDDDDIDDTDGQWVGLDEYEGLNIHDTWENLEPYMMGTKISRHQQQKKQQSNSSTYSWDKDVVIDTVAVDTTTTTTNTKSTTTNTSSSLSSSDKDNHKKKNQFQYNNDFAVQAAQNIIKQKKNTTVGTTASNDDNTHNNNSSDGGGDYAVLAARKAATEAKKVKNKMGEKNGFIGDYAVVAAKKVVEAKKNAAGVATITTTTTANNNSNTPNATSVFVSNSPTTATTQQQGGGVPSQTSTIDQVENMNLENMLPAVSPMVKKGMGHHYTKPDAFRISISNPKTFAERQRNKRKTSKKTAVSNLEKNINKVVDVVDNQTQRSIIKQEQKKGRGLNIVTDNSFLSPDDINNEEERQKILNNLSLEIPRQPSSSSLQSTNNSKTKTKLKTKTRDEIEQDIYKAALEIMPGNNSKDNPDITAEQLLKDVLKFGEEQEAKEADGVGFVDGALNKARELLSLEQDSKQHQGISQILDHEYKSVESNTISKEEQELKRIFAAGQSLAEGRISLKQSKKNNSVVTDEYLDELIDSDKTVPRYARSIDDELAELEVRISRSPDQDYDQGDNALFDIFSGPEVYNPNVDPETAVNWPGALPGSRTDIKLPVELKMAINKARYAATVLSNVVEQDNNFYIQEDDNDINTGSNNKKYFVDGQEITMERLRMLQKCVEEGIAIGLIQDPFEYLQEKSRLDIVINELLQQPDERFGEIITSYKDLLLSDNFVTLLREKLKSMAKIERECKEVGDEDATNVFKEKQAQERRILGKLTEYAQLLLKETRALGAELEASQLEIIRSICKVAMDPSHETEEETAMALTDAVREMKPLLDEGFVAYLKYAIAEEEGRLARAGLLDDPDHNRWLFVLKIVQEGVYAELSRGVQRYIDHIGYILRMDTKLERKMLLSKLIDVMPSMDVRPFVKVVDNIAASLGTSTRGEFSDVSLGSMTNKILQLRRDVHDLLPPERIKTMSKDADEWAARQKAKLMEQRGISQQRLAASRDSQDYEEVIRRGEVERFD